MFSAFHLQCVAKVVQAVPEVSISNASKSAAALEELCISEIRHNTQSTRSTKTQYSEYSEYKDTILGVLGVLLGVTVLPAHTCYAHPRQINNSGKKI